MEIPRFHLAFPVGELASTREFYVDVLGCSVGREGERWLDFDFYGHQLSAHMGADAAREPACNTVDGEPIPVRHFGVILEWQAWHTLTARLRARHGEFLIEPVIRFAGQAGEQATLFIQDPSGNCIEFKAFKDRDQVFER